MSGSYPNAFGTQNKQGSWITEANNEYACMPQEKTMRMVSNAPEDLNQAYEGNPEASLKQERRDQSQFRKASRGGERKV